MIVDPNGDSRTHTLAAPLAISDDGRWLATGGPGRPLTVRRLDAPDTLVHTLDADVAHAAFSPDGTRLAWAFVEPATPTRVRARVLALSGSAAPQATSVRYEDSPVPSRHGPRTVLPRHISFTDDGADVLLMISPSERGLANTWHWRPAADKQRRLARRLILADTTRPVGTGAALWLPTRGIVYVHANTAGQERLGTIVPLASGGWLARTDAGALDGSDDAPLHLVSRVGVGETAVAHDGLLAWDAFHEPGAAARMLAGEDVPPPLPDAR